MTFIYLALTQFLTKENLLTQYPLCCVAQMVSTRNAWVSYSLAFLVLVCVVKCALNYTTCSCFTCATTVKSSKINNMYRYQNTSLTATVLFPMFTGIWWCSSVLCVPCWPVYPPWCWSCPLGWTWTEQRAAGEASKCCSFCWWENRK